MTPLLWIEDDNALVRVMGPLITGAGYALSVAKDATAARAAFAKGPPGLVLLDLMLPPTGKVEDGLALLSDLLALHPGTKVIVLSGAGRRRIALDAIRRGAHDFLDKPIDPDVLTVVLDRATTRATLERSVDELQRRLADSSPSVGMIGDSAVFLAAVDLADRVAPTPIPVLVTGENGTGKELMARRVHERSGRANGPLVVINCGALAPSLLESTLFGHTRGAFTGADKARAGVMVEADGGTLFLDEVGEMEPATQVRLLRAIDNQEVMPLGADRPRSIDVRFVCATNRDLAAMVADGTFRDDLYWRLNGVEIRLPPLRDRSTDILLLARFFAAEAARMVGRDAPFALDDRLRNTLLQHPWPGNLRELRHALRRAAVMAGPRGELAADQLGLHTAATPDGNTLADAVEALERRLITAALATEGDNRTRAAQRLGLSRQGLLNKIARYGL